MLPTISTSAFRKLSWIGSYNNDLRRGHNGTIEIAVKCRGMYLYTIFRSMLLRKTSILLLYYRILKLYIWICTDRKTAITIFSSIYSTSRAVIWIKDGTEFTLNLQNVELILRAEESGW